MRSKYVAMEKTCVQVYKNTTAKLGVTNPEDMFTVMDSVRRKVAHQCMTFPPRFPPGPLKK